MKNAIRSRLGFTLIELLVVVLIIGILAAVALPQYKKAVWKTRYAQAKVLAEKIADAEEVYFMENGQYTINPEELHISLPATSVGATPKETILSFPWGNCSIYYFEKRGDISCHLKRNSTDYLAYWLGLNFSNVSAGQRKCLAYGTTGKPALSDTNSRVCTSETKDPTANSFGSTSYSWDYQ